MPIKVGIIGLSTNPNSWIGTAHIEPLRDLPLLSSKYTVTALSTSSPASAAASAEKWNLPSEKAYSSAADIAADPDVDLVVVGVKVPVHKELTLPVLKAGKDVFVEWPLAKSVEEAEELVKAAKESGSRTVVGLQLRTSPVILKAKEIIDAGTLGRILSTNIRGVDARMISLPPAYDYGRDLTNGANLTTIPAGHVLDAMCFLLGEFSYLNAITKINFPVVNTPYHTGSPVTQTSYDSFSILGDLENGATATFQMLSTTSGVDSFEWIITGEKGSLKFVGSAVNIQTDPPILHQWQKPEYSEAGIYEKLDAAPKDEWKVVDVDPPLVYGQVGEIYEAFAYGEKVKGSLVDFEGAALRHRMLDACYKSARDGIRETYQK